MQVVLCRFILEEWGCVSYYCYGCKLLVFQTWYAGVMIIIGLCCVGNTIILCVNHHWPVLCWKHDNLVCQSSLACVVLQTRYAGVSIIIGMCCVRVYDMLVCQSSLACVVLVCQSSLACVVLQTRYADVSIIIGLCCVLNTICWCVNHHWPVLCY